MLKKCLNDKYSCYQGRKTAHVFLASCDVYMTKLIRYPFIHNSSVPVGKRQLES